MPRHDITELAGCPCLKYGYANLAQAKAVVRKTSAVRAYPCPHRANYFHVTSKATWKETKVAKPLTPPRPRCEHCSRKIHKGFCDGRRRERQIPWLIREYDDRTLYNFCDGEVLNLAYQMHLIPRDIENSPNIIDA